MQNNWKKEITSMILVKQQIMKLDIKNMWPHNLPELAAAENQIIKLENFLDFKLDEKYKSFLRAVNGWKGFYQTLDLFGTNEFMNSEIINYANMILNSIDEGVLEKSGFKREELLPIAITEFDKDIFAISKPDSHMPGMVIWFAGEEVDRFSDFEEYFLAMLDYNRMEVEDLKNELK